MLTLAMIARNEVRTIARTINAVLQYVDEVVVGLDVASSDGTRDVLAGLPCKVVNIHLAEELEISGPLDGGDEDWGFSRARNVVFAACNPRNWRLTLDGHETMLNPEAIAPSIAQAVKTGCDGVECMLEFEPDDNGNFQTSFGTVRLMAPQVLYRNPIHNLPANKRTYTDHKLRIEHCKQDQAPESQIERDVQRAKVNIKGFRKKLRTEGDDSRSWFYLATAYKEGSQNDAAVKAFEECLKYSKWNEERWHARVGMGVCYNRLNDTLNAKEQYILAITEFPAMAEAYYYVGELAYKQKRYYEAQVWLEKCIELEQPVSSLFVNPMVYKVLRHDVLAMVYNHLGQFGKAIEQAEIALKAGPSERIEKNVRVWREHVAKHGADYYDKLWKGDRPMTEKETLRIEMMVKVLNESKEVLDVGCGPGWVCGKLDAGVHYTGVDISQAARSCVEKKGGSAVATLEELNGQRFDGCVLGEFLEHTLDDVATLKEIASHLAPGAVIIASVSRYAVMQDPAHTRDYTPVEFKRLMATVGEAEMLESIGPWMLCKSVV